MVGPSQAAATDKNGGATARNVGRKPKSSAADYRPWVRRHSSGLRLGDQDSWLGDILASTVSAAEAAGRHTPNSVAIKTTIMDKVPLLETLRTAGRANTALIQPIAVGIQAVLNVIFVDRKPQIGS